MINALIRGVSSEETKRENFLTAIVFGALGYLPYESGLYRVLLAANRQSSKDWIPKPSPDLEVEYRFWPAWQLPDGRGIEPDVTIDFRMAGQVMVRLLVESKLNAPKSPRANSEDRQVTDQLGKEWIGLVDKCVEDAPRPSTPMMLYVTQWASDVEDDIGEAIAELKNKSDSIPAYVRDRPLQCLWLSWGGILNSLDAAVGQIERDLCSALRRLLVPDFRGIPPIEIMPGAEWSWIDRFSIADVKPVTGVHGESLWTYVQRFAVANAKPVSDQLGGMSLAPISTNVPLLWRYSS